jgi:DNA-binding PucR family transcriptional regulator
LITSVVAQPVRASPVSSKRVDRAVLGGILDLPAEECGVLLSTLESWLDASGSATETGRRVYAHPNTVRHRLKPIERNTGRALENPRAVAELAVARQAVLIFPDIAEPG